ncbi:acetyl-coenzyme A synthetase N-terminal domain-containing protein [Gordonia sp. N1V]|nr:acetyl-coenzyme A synthetase N-terminal domain-containing protein [Gordonia sp. N1V]MDF3283176.1 acetyl-coenzyme A synthetase N-terminal domain-containing protein [Gordonia sp. N1V]
MNERPDGSTEPPPVHEAGVLWAPSAERIVRSALRAYLDWLECRESLRFADHDALRDWSVADLDRFWTSIAECFGVEFSTGPTRIRTADPMPFTRWFPGATLNWAQRVSSHGAGDDVALVCVHDFGTDGTVCRLAQLEPTVLIAVDAYHWNGRAVDRRDVVAQLRIDLPTVRHVITVPYMFPAPTADTAVLWDDVVNEPGELTFEQVEFSHPLWVLFTSGTTGSPKGLVHGHGGITLESSNGPACIAVCDPASACSPTPPPDGRCGTCSSAHSPRARASSSTKAVRAIRRARCGRWRRAPART